MTQFARLDELGFGCCPTTATKWLRIAAESWHVSNSGNHAWATIMNMINKIKPKLVVQLPLGNKGLQAINRTWMNAGIVNVEIWWETSFIVPNNDCFFITVSWYDSANFGSQQDKKTSYWKGSLPVKVYILVTSDSSIPHLPQVEGLSPGVTRYLLKIRFQGIPIKEYRKNDIYWILLKIYLLKYIIDKIDKIYL